jgi:hypothetical protein
VHSFFWLPIETGGERAGGEWKGVCDVFCKVRFLLKSALWGNIAFFFLFEALARILMYHSESIGRRERKGTALWLSRAFDGVYGMVLYFLFPPSLMSFSPLFCNLYAMGLRLRGPWCLLAAQCVDATQCRVVSLCLVEQAFVF